jgi:hypothetical protein
MTKKRVDRERNREGLRRFANSTRDTADDVGARWQADDPLHPLMPTGDDQPFRDWLDFVDRVARPLVEATDHDAEQAAMVLYRKASPYFICVALVMAANRADPASVASADDDGPSTFRWAMSLLGRQVKVYLSRDHEDPATVAVGQLLAIDEGGQIVVRDDMGFVHYCWPLLGIEALDG